MPLPVNAFKRALRDGTRQLGLWAGLCHAGVAEILSDAGYDFLVVDSEHAPNELPSIVEQLRVLQHTNTSAIVRPPWNDPVIFKRLLDVGTQTLLVPLVQNAEEAARAVAATRYPPQGIRGVASTHRANRYGKLKDYFHHAHEELCVIVQLETRAALAQLEEVASLDGIDAVFIGPSDLSADMGHLGNAAHPEVQTAIADACARSRRAGKPIGILAPIPDDARRYLEMGFSFVAVGSDSVLLRTAAESLLKSFQTASS